MPYSDYELKELRVCIYLYPEQRAYIDRECAKLGMTRTHYIESKILPPELCKMKRKYERKTIE